MIEARATADQSVFASGALKVFRLVWPKHKFPPTEVYLRLARPKYKWQPTAIFLQLRWLQHEWTRTEVFSRLARPKFFAIGTIETKLSADFIFFAIGASDSRPKFFCAWRDQKFLRLEPVETQVSANRKFVVTGSTDAPVTADGIVLAMARTKQNYHRQKFLRLLRPMLKCTPTEVFLHLARPNLFLTGADEAQVSFDRFFFELRRAKY